MIKLKIPNVLRAVSDSFEGKTNLENENRFVCFFGSFLMITGSIASFLSLYFILNEDISQIWLNCTIMLIMAISLIVVSRIIKNEIIKTYLLEEGHMENELIKYGSVINAKTTISFSIFIRINSTR